jgi:signal transduction histidine kinase
LAQIFQNVLGNAVKFRRHDVPPEVHIGARRVGRMWELCVRDNGIGIDPEYHDKLFVLFKRLHSREQYPGTGIGLAICKKIVEQHGGEIWMESKPGEGAAFFFTLPESAA